MTRAMARTLRWIATTPGIDVARTLRDFFPDVAPDIFAAVIDRYRALGLFATDPVLQREGFDRLQAAMLSGGAIAREFCTRIALTTRWRSRQFAQREGRHEASGHVGRPLWVGRCSASGTRS